MTAELMKWRRIYYSLSLNLKQYIHEFQREKDMFITLSVVYIQISNTYLPEFPNILLYVEANPVWMCRLYSAVIFSSKLDYSYRTTNVLKAFFSAMHAVWSLWSCIYHEIKEILRKLRLSEYFKPFRFISVFIHSRA